MFLKLFVLCFCLSAVYTLSHERIHSRPKSAVENAPITAPITPTTPPVNKRLNTMQRCQVAGRSGECVVIETCDPFVRLIKHQRANPGPGLTRFFKEAHCGFDGTVPKVCCPILDQLPVEGFEETKSSSLQYGQKVPILDENDFVTHLPEPPVCGTSNASYFRDIGSTEAKLGEFPWMALLGYKTGEVTSWNCGGSLITSKHVLTAARCIHDQEESLYVVRLGEMDLIREDDGATPIDILIRKMVQHPQYDSVTVTNDIGFLVLQQEVEFTDFIHPICLPLNIELRTNTFERYNPMVAGWNMEYKGPAASWLQATQLPVISITACANAYKNHTTQLIDARVMCADGHADDSNGNCVGNSGDPLMLPIWYPQVRKAYFYQLGVVFFGKMCEQPGYPAVYTRVTAFVPWLEEMLLGKTPLDY